MVAVRLADGRFGLVGSLKDKFAAEAWLKRDGDERTPEMAAATGRDDVKCDALGCIAKMRNGTRVAITFRADALAEDCASAQVVVSALPAHDTCHGPKLVIDRQDIRRDGAYAVWLQNGGLPRVVTVQNERGDRPWSQPPRAFVRRRDQ
jgi:competence protein ComEC